MDGDVVVDMITNSDDDSVALLDTDCRSWELIVHSHNTCRVAQPHYSCVFHLLTNYYQHMQCSSLHNSYVIPVQKA
jgi:hypothetical protein